MTVCLLAIEANLLVLVANRNGVTREMRKKEFKWQASSRLIRIIPVWENDPLDQELKDTDGSWIMTHDNKKLRYTVQNYFAKLVYPQVDA